MNELKLARAASFSLRYLPTSNWSGHAPFATWLIGRQLPRLVVELGTASGTSYFAFCQAVAESGLEAKCYAVSSWTDGPAEICHGEDLFTLLHAHNVQYYASFSHLLRATLEVGPSHFSDGTIDLLHINGDHCHDSILRNFKFWLPKLSQDAVVLFYGTNCRYAELGSWEMWEQLKQDNPFNFEFYHSQGMGVLQLAHCRAEKQLPIFNMTPTEKETIRDYFAILGSRQIDRQNPTPRNTTFPDHELQTAEALLKLKEKSNLSNAKRTNANVCREAMTHLANDGIIEDDGRDGALRGESASKAGSLRGSDFASEEDGHCVPAGLRASPCSDNTTALQRELEQKDQTISALLAQSAALQTMAEQYARLVNVREKETLIAWLRKFRRKSRPIRYFLMGKKVPPVGAAYAYPGDEHHQGSNLRLDRLDLDFDDEAYLTLNPDVAHCVRTGAFHSAREHFIRHGINEISSCQPRVFRFKLGKLSFDFDETAYVSDNPDIRPQIASGAYRNGLEHFLRAGYTQCVHGMRSIYSANRFIRLVGQVEGAKRSSRRRMLVLFAHYDRDGIVDDYVLRYLEALSILDADICFITAVDDPLELKKVRSRVSKIIIKNDAGRDFGSWYLALKTLAPEISGTYEHIVFVNDSIYFPVVDPSDFFARMQTLKFNLWGLTDSREQGVYHLQSFWLVFDHKAQKVVFPEFIRRFEATPYMTKAGQIASFEFGLSHFAADQGLAIGAYCAIDDIRDDVIRWPQLSRWLEIVQKGIIGVNATHRLWDLLVGYYRFPGLKLELLRDNPLHMKIEGWQKTIDPQVLNAGVVERHLERMRSMPKSREKTRMNIRVAAANAQLVERIDGEGFCRSKRLVLLAHYDPHGLIDPHVEYSISSLRNCDCDVVLLTSTATESEIDRVRKLCATVLLTDNKSRDFGAWHFACRTLRQEFNHYDSLIWMNDSSYFPLFDPHEMFAAMALKNPNFWGVVDSHSIRWHVMSWFWSFDRKIIGSGWIDWYLQEFDPGFSKWDQIRNFEMRVPSNLKQSGFSADSYVSADEVYRYVSRYERSHERFTKRIDFTMTHDFWDVIIRKFRCPALKVELIRDNPLGIELKGALDLVKAHTNYDPELIRNHIRRIKTSHLQELAKIASIHSAETIGRTY